MVYREIRKFEIGEHRIEESARSAVESIALGSQEVLGGRKAVYATSGNYCWTLYPIRHYIQYWIQLSTVSVLHCIKYRIALYPVMHCTF